MEVITKNEFIKRVTNNFKQETGSVEEISSIFIETMFICMQQGLAIDFGKKYAVLKPKVSKPHINKGSPRQPRREHIIITGKMSLYDENEFLKNGIEEMV